MSYEFYKIIHHLGLTLVFIALGGIALHVMNGGTKQTNGVRKLAMMSHGIGLLLTLVGGFGQLAKLGIHGLPGWALLKLVLWAILGSAAMLVYRNPTSARAIWFFMPFAIVLGGFLALVKPF